MGLHPAAPDRSPLRRALLALCCPLWLFSTAALAAPTPNPPAAASPPATDEEEVLDERLREFGYWSGAAFTCAAAAQQPEVQRQVIEAYQRVARLFGTDRAFFYAAAFGRGTAFEVGKASCPELLDWFRRTTVLHGGPTRGAR